MDLLEGERVIWAGRPSWRSMIAFYLTWGLVGLLPLAAGIVLDQTGNADRGIEYGAIATVVVLLLVALSGWLRRIDTHYTVTDRRIVIRHGIVSRKEQSAHLDRIQNVNVSQGVIERLLRVGTVDFDTAGTTDSDFRFAGINDPQSLRQRFDEEYMQRVRETAPPQR